METEQIFSEPSIGFEHDCISSPYVTSLDHFPNKNSSQPSEQISLNKYSEHLHNTCFQNTYNNSYNELEMFNVRQNPDYVMQHCSNNERFSENHFNSAQRLGTPNCLYEENLPNECSLLYEHKSHASVVNSGLEFNQSCNINNFSTLYKNSVRTQNNIKPTSMVKASIPLGVDKSNFNTRPPVQNDKIKNENLPFILSDSYTHHWSDLGMGKMKIECWEIMVFCRNHSIYVNPGLMAQSIGLAKSLVRKLIQTTVILEKMTQLEVSILKYIRCLSTTTHNTGLIPLADFLNTLYTRLDDNKPYQTHVKYTIKTFTDKLYNGFVPAISNIPYDLTSFFNSNYFYKSSNQDGSDRSRRFKIVSHLILENKSFSLIEHNGDFYMHLGEMVSNGVFPCINLVRRKIRKMRISTKWLDSLESQYLNLSQEQELIKFSDLRILCGLILYLHPNMHTDLLQMFSAMDLSDYISSVNPLRRVQYGRNDVQIEDTAKKKFQYLAVQPHNRFSTVKNRGELHSTESFPTISSTILPDQQRKVIFTPYIKDDTHSVDSSVRMEKLDQNYDPENGNISKENPCVIQEKRLPSIPRRGKSILPEERVERCKILPSQKHFMHSVKPGEAKVDILGVAFKELLDGDVGICRPTSDISNSQILYRSDEATNSDSYVTHHDDQDMYYYNEQDKNSDCYLPSTSEFSANYQLEKGNDRFANYVTQNYSNEQSLKRSKTAFQIPEVFETSTFNNGLFNKEYQMQPSQFTDLTANNLVENYFPASNNNSGIFHPANPSKAETFAGFGRSTDTRLHKRQIDPQKRSQLLNTYKSLDGSNIDQSPVAKYFTFDKYQSSLLQANQSVTLQSSLPPSAAAINANNSEISRLSMVSSSKVCNDQIRIPFLNTPTVGNEEQLLCISPQITLPTVNNKQKGTGSFQEPEKDNLFTQKKYPLSKPSNKSRNFSSKYTQSKILRNNTFQEEDILPSTIPCNIDNMPPHNSDSTNNNLLPSGDGQLLTSNTPFQKHQINDFSSPSMLGSFNKCGIIPYKAGILPSNSSLIDNKSIVSDHVGFQGQRLCYDSNDATTSLDKSKLMLTFTENLGGKALTGKNITPIKTTSCSEPLHPVKYNSLCAESSSCGEFKECNTSNLYLDDCSNIEKRTTLSVMPNMLTMCASSNFITSSPIATFNQTGTFQTNKLNTNRAKSLNKSITNECLPESREIVINSLALRSEISLQKSEMHKEETIDQRNVPCITSIGVPRSYKEQSLEKSLDLKPQTKSDQVESSRVTSIKPNHDLEIASMAAIDTLVMKINQDKLYNCVSSQNVKTKDKCSLILPRFETDMQSKLSQTLETSDSSETGVKESKDTLTVSSAISNSEKKVITELSELNELLTDNIVETNQHKVGSFCTNNQFTTEISHTIDLNSQNSPYSVTNHKQRAPMKLNVISSSIKSVENDSQSVKRNSIRDNKLQCQKTIIQNEGNYPVSLGYKPMEEILTTHKNEFNMKSIVANKHEKQLNSPPKTMSVSTGSLQYTNSSTGTKAKNSLESDNCGNLFPGSIPQTTSKQISVIDMVDIVKLCITENRLHLDVAITDQARSIFENENKDNPVEAKKIFLQQFANLVCQFTKCWVGLRAAKSLDDENRNYVTTALTGKTRTFQKNMFSRQAYQSGVAKEKNVQIPPILHSNIISCYCSRRLCGEMKIPPENETSKKIETNLKGKSSKTNDTYCNFIEEPSCKSDQSNLVLFQKTNINHNSCFNSSKFYEIECTEQISQEKPGYCEFGLRSKSTKRKSPSLENEEAKKTKY